MDLGRTNASSADEQSISGRESSTGLIFICHSSVDAALARRIAEELESSGRQCWIAPRDVVPGEAYAGQIVSAISACSVFLLLLTSESADSPHVLREVELAASARHRLLPVVVDGAMSDNLAYYCSGLHRIEVTVGSLIPTLKSYFDGTAQASTSATSAIPEIVRPRRTWVLSWGLAALMLVVVGGTTVAIRQLANPPASALVSVVASSVTSDGSRVGAALLPTTATSEVAVSTAQPPVESPSTQSADLTWYSNQRFGFRCLVPAGWRLQELEGGDGARVSDPASPSTVVECRAGVISPGTTSETLHSEAKRSLIAQGVSITYDKVSSTIWAVSGVDVRGMIWYSWGQVGPSQSRTIAWSYPQDRHALIDGWVTRSVRDFVPGKLS